MTEESGPSHTIRAPIILLVAIILKGATSRDLNPEPKKLLEHSCWHLLEEFGRRDRDEVEQLVEDVEQQ